MPRLARVSWVSDAWSSHSFGTSVRCLVAREAMLSDTHTADANSCQCLTVITHHALCITWQSDKKICERLTDIQFPLLTRKRRICGLLTAKGGWSCNDLGVTRYSKTCLKRNAIVPVFFFPFSQVSVLQRVVF